MPFKAPILITGAGPSGMALALWLHKLGTPFRIIDKLSGPGQTSRATVVHAHTLEHYRQLGIAERLVEAGIEVHQLVITHRGSETRRIQLTHGGEDALSPYPYMLALPQDMHEQILVDVLRERGVEIERNIELLENKENEGAGVVEAKLRRADGSEEVFAASYVCGCDGAHSTIRHAAGINMAGGTYSQRFFVADIDVAPGTLPAGPTDLNLNMSTHEYCMVIPTIKHGNARLIGFVPKDKVDLEHVTLDDVLPNVKECVPKLQVTGVKWFSAYRVHHRAAEHFRSGRLFICGDASHLHSPVGGQGMNTGIGDASNLAWKLAYVHSGRAHESLLDTYESERIGFAHELVNTTDRGFTALTDEGWKGWFAREFLVPYIMPTLMDWTGRSVWETMSQIKIEYKASPLSENGPSVHGGQYRLVAGNRIGFVQNTGPDGLDNFEALAETRWLVHLYGEMDQDVEKNLRAKGVEVRTFKWSSAAKERGLVEGFLYLVRPDGYIGAVASPGDADTLLQYVSKWGLTGTF